MYARLTQGWVCSEFMIWNFVCRHILNHILRPDYPVVGGVLNRSARQKPSRNPKVLATFSHTTAGIGTRAMLSVSCNAYSIVLEGPLYRNCNYDISAAWKCCRGAWRTVPLLSVRCMMPYASTVSCSAGPDMRNKSKSFPLLASVKSEEHVHVGSGICNNRVG